MPEQASQPDTLRTALPAWVSDVSNVLVLAPSSSSGVTAACADLLALEEPTDATVLGVTYAESASEWVERWETRVSSDPARGTVISVGGTDTTSDGCVADAWTVIRVDPPSNLTRLGVAFTEALDGAREADDADGVALCFDSLTASLQYADVNRLFQFLHAVTGRIASAGGVGHYHLDPDACDDRTVATVAGLFDAVVEVDDGEYTVTPT